MARKRTMKCLCPFPVYEAHMRQGGRVVIYRMSFATPAGKAVDPARGRLHFEGVYGAPRGELLDGFVEHDVPGQPWVRFRDPAISGAAAAPAKAPRVTVKQTKAVIADLLGVIEGKVIEGRPSIVTAARELIAA